MKENTHLATSELNRMKVIKAAESVIQWIINERQENAALAASIKDGTIRKYRDTLWAKIRYRNTTDEVFWRSYCPHPAEYSDAKWDARTGYGYQLEACKRLLGLALASTTDTIAVTDAGFNYIKKDFDLQ